MTPPLDRFEWERLIRALDGYSIAVKCTAYALATYANGDGTKAHPGLEQLIVATGGSRSTVIRSLSVLESEGFINAISRGGGKGVQRGNATVYELTVPDLRPKGRHARDESL